jgi:hypothetical protein
MVCGVILVVNGVLDDWVKRKKRAAQVLCEEEEELWCFAEFQASQSCSRRAPSRSRHARVNRTDSHF